MRSAGGVNSRLFAPNPDLPMYPNWLIFEARGALTNRNSRFPRRLVTSKTARIIAASLSGRTGGGRGGGEAGGKILGKPVSLADNKACRRYAGRTRHGLRAAHRVGAPISRP